MNKCTTWQIGIALAVFMCGVGGLCAAEENMSIPKDKIAEAVSWLETEAHRIIRASGREMKDGTAAFPPQVGIGYEAFWLRDYEYALEGSISSFSDKELLDACRLFVRSLNPDGAGVDCVKFDGTPIYKPGYGSLGENPVADGGPFTVGVAFHTYRKTKDAKLLGEMLPLLVRTMGAVPRNPETGLVHIDPKRAWDRCPYGFTDSVRKQGDVLFDSLLFVQACRQLSELLKKKEDGTGGTPAPTVRNQPNPVAAGFQPAGAADGRAGKPAPTVGNRSNPVAAGVPPADPVVDEARKWQEEANRVTASIRKVFWDGDIGLFRAATVKCREHDIWGSAFAVFLGVAEPAQSKAIAHYFKTHYDQIVQHGQIRHLPGGVYWELCLETASPRDYYQNGAYWATPTGWFVYTLDLADPALADRTILDMVSHFKQHGACEWIIGEQCKLPNYLASAALPLDGIRAMLGRRQWAGGSGQWAEGRGQRAGGRGQRTRTVYRIVPLQASHSARTQKLTSVIRS